ncbi:maltose acetyltransferase domain-containing protein [Terribacillus saccharophilus]|uniref:maltose acetyltransferase domain-containing protein n=1 Tax=Terribacillus saccharophilus TaxID=361277 RepID=UPI00398295A0
MGNRIKDSQHNSSMYLPGDKELAACQTLCLERLYDFNQTRPSELEKREITDHDKEFYFKDLRVVEK